MNKKEDREYISAYGDGRSTGIILGVFGCAIFTILYFIVCWGVNTSECIRELQKITTEIKETQERQKGECIMSAFTESS